MDKTAFNLNEKIASALCYILGPLSGLIMYFFEMRRGTKNIVVIFHSLQCIVVLGGLSLLQFGLMFLPFTNILTDILSIFSTIVWAYLIYQAISGKTYKVPVIGDICWEKANKV